MKNRQRLRLAMRCRQASELLGARVDSSLATGIAKADHPLDAATDTEVTAGVSGLIPAEFPLTRARLADAGPGDQAAILQAISEALEPPSVQQVSVRTLYFNLGLLAAIMLMFTFFVVPAFSAMFEVIGADLPAPTMLAIALARWVLAPAGVLIAVGLVVLWMWKKRPTILGKLASRLDGVTRRLPQFGRGIQILQTQRIARWLAAVGGGADAGRSLGCLQELLDEGLFARQVSVLRQSLASGRSLAEALAGAEWLPGLSKLLKEKPEDRNALAAYAESLDANSSATVQRLVLVTQVIVGVIIGFFVIAMYMPIFKMGSAI